MSKALEMFLKKAAASGDTAAAELLPQVTAKARASIMQRLGHAKGPGEQMLGSTGQKMVDDATIGAAVHDKELPDDISAMLKQWLHGKV